MSKGTLCDTLSRRKYGEITRLCHCLYVRPPGAVKWSMKWRGQWGLHSSSFQMLYKKKMALSRSNSICLPFRVFKVFFYSVNLNFYHSNILVFKSNLKFYLFLADSFYFLCSYSHTYSCDYLICYPYSVILLIPSFSFCYLDIYLFSC